jgi:DNA-binding GntR family transcriptional regulator
MPTTQLDERSQTLTGSVYGSLRAAILSGEYKPNEKLRAETLRKQFDVGVSPIREALNRLLAEGLVSQEEQKGFRVSPVSKSELSELLQTRCWIDGQAIRESIERFEPEWEENLVLALHRLARASRTRDSGDPDSERSWEALHKAFHCALVNGCGSRWMKQISLQLFYAAERYRLLSTSYVAERNELEEHRAITEACLNRDADAAVALLCDHYGRTWEVVSRHIPD